MRVSILILVLMIFTIKSFAADDTPLAQQKWFNAEKNVLDFFNAHAWDEASGTYASELDELGHQKSDVREIVPLSRLIYSNARAPQPLGDLRKAQRSAEFIIMKMIVRDAFGPRFLSAVSPNGQEVDVGRSYSFIFEQSYGLAGLVALYSADREKEAALLALIRESADAFWRRFHDEKSGGLYYYFNLRDAGHANDQGQVHKSYQSTLYPISSFLLELRRADPARAVLYDQWINELLEIAMLHIVRYDSAGEPTGWLNERFDANFTVDESYPMTESGHITQLAWVIGEAIENGIVPLERVREYQVVAQTLLSKFMRQGGVSSSTKTAFDAFDHESGRPLRDHNVAKASWWANLEAIIAFDSGLKKNWFQGEDLERARETLSGLAGGYFQYFLDNVHGGEYFQIDAETGVVTDATKGNGGKSAYHLTEAYIHLFH